MGVKRTWDRNAPIWQDHKVFQEKEKHMKERGKGRRGGEVRARRQEKERLSPDEKTDYREVSCTHLRSEN